MDREPEQARAALDTIKQASAEALREVQSVKDWAFEVENAIRDQLKKSNLYQSLDNVMGDLGSFGTSVIYVEDDLKDGIRGYVFPIGSYCLASNGTLRPDTCFRELRMPVRGLVSEFGEENCSNTVKQHIAGKRLDAEIDVTHVIEPNTNYQPGKLGPAGMEYSSVWFETASAGDVEGKFLREGGYAECPLMMVRWNTTGEDVYGSDCPGFEEARRTGVRQGDESSNGWAHVADWTTLQHPRGRHHPRRQRGGRPEVRAGNHHQPAVADGFRGED